MSSKGGNELSQLGVVSRFRQQSATAILAGVDKAIATRWEPAKERAARLTGATTDDKIRQLTEVYARELGIIGATVGGAAAVPGVGTAAVLAASATEIGWFTLRSSELVLTIGAVHGHSDVAVEEQRAWILSVLVFGSSASEAFTKLAMEVGKGLGKKSVQTIPMSSIKAVNNAFSRTIITKYGTKRGVVSLGRALPFGIGAAVGGTMNYGGVRLLGRHADKFFTNLPYERILPEENDDGHE